MGIKRYYNGAWQDVNTIKRYSNGAWREISEGKIYKNGAWETIWPEGVTIEVLYPVLSDAYAGKSIWNNIAYISFNNATTNAETLVTAEIRVLCNGTYVAFGEGFTVDMSVYSDREDETFFRYDTGKNSSTLYMEYDSIDGYYYGTIEDTVPANCKRIYIGDEGDDVVLKGKIGELSIHVTSSITKIKEVVFRNY